MDIKNVIRMQQFIFAPLKDVMIKAIDLVEAKIDADAVDPEKFIGWLYTTTVDNATNSNTLCTVDVSFMPETKHRLSCRVQFWYYNQPDGTGISGYYDLASGEFKTNADVNVHVTRYIYDQLDLIVKQLVTDFDTATELPPSGIFAVQHWVDVDREQPR